LGRGNRLVALSPWGEEIDWLPSPLEGEGRGEGDGVYGKGEG